MEKMRNLVRFALVKSQVLIALKCYVHNQPKLCPKTAFLMNCGCLWIGFEDLDWIGFEFLQVDLIWN